MSRNQVKSKSNNSIYTIFGLLADILFYPIILISIITCFAILTDKQEGKMPSVFGLAFGYISSGSMTRTGFEIGDIILTFKTNPDKLRAGDIITFYYYLDRADYTVSKNTLTVIQTYDRENNINGDYAKGTATAYERDLLNSLRNNYEGEKTERKQINDLPGSTKVYFHRIVGVYSNSKGELFFQTEGDSNASPDSYFISADYVSGKYVNTPSFVSDIFTFMSSPTGILTLVVIPLSILLLFLLFSIIEQINRIILENKVLSREIRFDEEDVRSANIGKDMEEITKVKFFAETPQKDKQDVVVFLWGHLNSGSNSDRRLFDEIKRITLNFEKKPNDYWKFWDFYFKTPNNKKAVAKFKEQWLLVQGLNTNFKKGN